MAMVIIMLDNEICGFENCELTKSKDNHNYASPQCGTPYYSSPKSPYDPARIGIAGEYGGIGHNVSIEQLV